MQNKNNADREHLEIVFFFPPLTITVRKIAQRKFFEPNGDMALVL